MNRAKLSISDLNLRGRRVFIRADFNVPLSDGEIADDTRIRASLPTIDFALERGATVVLASHLGRPKGKPAPDLSLRVVASRLSELLGRSVGFSEDCVGDAAIRTVAYVHGSGGGVVLLENLRFHAEEERNDPGFARQLASLADAYVDDAFGAAHRAHASVEALAHCFPQAAAGLLMEQELRYLGHVLEAAERPFVAILGGAKVSDKLETLQNLTAKVDRLLIGGAMAYTFLKSRGMPIGQSRVEDDKLAAAGAIDADARARGIRFELPIDHVVADRVAAGAAHEVLKIGGAGIEGRYGVDIGPDTVVAYEKLISDARTVLWNGPMGVFEIEAFAGGTMAVARAVAAVRGTTIIGGGDSIAAVKKAGVADRITHISTGGGASLEFLGGRILPGVAALSDKSREDQSGASRANHEKTPLPNHLDGLRP